MTLVLLPNPNLSSHAIPLSLLVQGASTPANTAADSGTRVMPLKPLGINGALNVTKHMLKINIQLFIAESIISNNLLVPPYH